MHSICGSRESSHHNHVLTFSLSSVKDGMLVSGVLANGAGCPPSALTLSTASPAEDAAESTRRCAPRMEPAAESTTCSTGHLWLSYLTQSKHDLCKALNFRHAHEYPHSALVLLNSGCQNILNGHTKI